MRALIAAALTVCCLAACQDPNVGSRSSGSMAASRDDQLLYAADTDNGVLGVVDVKTQKVVATVKVGDAPWRVVVGPDDTVFVANRGSRSVSVIRRGEWTVAAELATDVDPVGLAMATDGTLYVVCATASDAAEYGTLTAYDSHALTKQWSLAIGEEPRGIALVSGNRALVSLYHAGEVVEVDLTQRALVNRQGSTLYQSANRSGLTSTPTSYVPGNPVNFHPRALNDVVASPDGNRVYALGTLAREAPILVAPSTFTPYYKAQGPGLAGSVTTSAVFTYDTELAAVPTVDDISALGTSTSYSSSNQDSLTYPQTSYAATGSSRAVLQGPTVGVTDYSGEWLYVVNRETNTLALVSAKARVAKPAQETNTGYDFGSSRDDLPSLHSAADIGAGADGLVVMGDNKSAYVYSQFDHQVHQVVLDGQTRRLSGKGAVATIGGETLSPALVEGRKLFFDATDRRVSALEASVACSSCHLEGRDDGHTWNFPDGPRQTPTLAGRGILETAPFHWSGEFPQIQDFLTHTLTARMGGRGLDAQASDALNLYMGKLPAPENPYLGAALTVEQLRGRQVFTKANCQSCHSGQWLTNGANAQVETLATRDNGLVVKGGLNVPSLRGLARSGPYLHDGSVTNLSERVLKNPGDKHGVTSALSDQEKSDLVAYLRTL